MLPVVWRHHFDVVAPHLDSVSWALEDPELTILSTDEAEVSFLRVLCTLLACATADLDGGLLDDDWRDEAVIRAVVETDAGIAAT